MRIGIVSDIHDNVVALRAALSELRSADALLVAGDLCAPFVLRMLGDGFRGGTVHVVAGNNDGDWLHLAKTARAFDHVELHGPVFLGDVGGAQVFLNHYPDIAAAVDASRFDLIVCGHDHTYSVARDGRAWRLDPGTLLGYAPRQDAAVDPTFLLFDTDAGTPSGFRLVPPPGAATAGALRVEPLAPPQTP